VRALVLVEERHLVTMLGDSEGPAHTDWSARTLGFAGRYVDGRDWISFIKRAPQELVAIGRGQDEKPDPDVTAAYFSIRLPKPSDHGDPHGPAPPRPPAHDKRPLREAPTADGFRIVLIDPNPGLIGRRVRVECAYDRRRGNPFTHWRTEDFDLTLLNVQVAGGQLVKTVDNVVEARVDDPSIFEVAVRGFDTNRDLLLRSRLLAATT
jgi:hypothetical protein